MFLYIGIGIISSIVVSWFFQEPLSWIFLATGIVFALLPDIDFIAYFKEKDKLACYKHRMLLHNPLPYILLGGLIAWLFLGKAVAILFLLASVLHFIHDSFGIGRGIRWLYPFSRNGCAFIYLHSRQLKWGLWRRMFVFDEKYLAEFDRDHGDRDWIKKIYFRPHIFSIFEYVVFISALIIWYFYVKT